MPRDPVMKKTIRRILLAVVAIIGLLVVTAFAALSYTTACPEPSQVGASDAATTVVVHECYGGPEVLQLKRVPLPQPADGEILVRVIAAGVNPLDWHYMRGSPYFMRLMSGIGEPAETRLGVDFSGRVEAVGSGVSKFKPGDEVFGSRTGAFADYVLLRETSVATLKPDNISHDEAAGVGIAATTALQALRDAGQLEPGQKVLINGASGGVGTYAVQIAKAMGAEVYGVCSTRNVDLVRSLGADRVFDYKKENYTESGIEFDVIVDMVGNHGLSDNQRVLKPRGRLVIVGGGKGNWIGPLVTPLKAMFKSPFTDQALETLLAQLNQDDMRALAEMLRDGRLRTAIDRRYPLDDIRSAIEYSESGRARGKIIVVPE